MSISVLFSTNLQALESALEIKSQEDKNDDVSSVQSSCIEANPFEAQMNYIEQLIEEKKSQGANDEVATRKVYKSYM